MSNMDWMRGNFKKTPGYVCPPGKKDFPSMSFHSTAVVKGYADGGKTLPPGTFASKEDEEKKDFLPSLGEVLQGVALLSMGARMADGIAAVGIFSLDLTAIFTVAFFIISFFR